MNPDVTKYIKSAPKDQQPLLDELRAMIRKALPRAAEEMSPSGFAVYTHNGEWVAGFATRKKCPMFYCMRAGVLDRHDDTLGKLRSGRSCIDFRETKDLSFDDLRKIARKILANAKKTL